MAPANDGATSSSNAVTSGETQPAASSSSSTLTMPALAKHKAELMTSIWENGTTVLQYGYCQNINDGRGYTSGRAGFCSGTGDAIQVVQCLAQAAPNAAMAKYIPALTTINNTFESSGDNVADTSALDAVGTYCADWSADAADATVGAAMQSCQDQIVSQLYFAPAIAEATKYGLSQPLTIAALYDAEINHGDDGDNGVADLAKRANTQAGNVSGHRTLAQESTWLHAFLTIRLALLKGDPTWADSVDRVANYEKQREAENWDMSKPIVTTAKATSLFGAGYKDSGYPSCTISASGSVSGDADCTNPHPSGDDDDDDSSGDDDDSSK